jgi:hypothetical protein
MESCARSPPPRHDLTLPPLGRTHAGLKLGISLGPQLREHRLVLGHVLKVTAFVV